MSAIALLVTAPFIGSFLAVLVDRLPRGGPIANDRSRCRACDRVLGPAEMIPLLSWAIQGGRCRGCGATIPWKLPAMEAAALAIAAWSVLVVPPDLAWITAAFGWLLLTMSAIDAETFWLPDALTLPLIPAGLAVNVWLEGGWLEGGIPTDALIGAAAGWILFAAVILVYRRMRGRDGMGWGDAKLLAAGGAWVGWTGLSGIILIASLAGLAAAVLLGKRRSDAAMPFGPALALGIWLTWLYGPLLLGGA